MSKKIDMTGKVCGRLHVIGEDFNDKSSKAKWLCWCDCEKNKPLEERNIKSYDGYCLRKGITKSCGCLMREKAAESCSKLAALTAEERKINLIGKTFGRLHVIKEDPIRKNNQIYWLCWCDCEKDKPLEERNIKSYCGNNLKAGHTKSCGCWNKEVAKKSAKIMSEKYKGITTIDITNQKFGKLTALYPTDKRKSGSVIWHCKCDCGNEYDVSSTYLRLGNVKSCGCLNMSFGEYKINQILKENNINFEKEKTFKSCCFIGTKLLARFDFFVNEEYLIEFDGQQHFHPSKFGNMSNKDAEERFEKSQERDKFKNQWCIENKIPLIRIPYTHLDNLCLEDLQLETSKFIVAGTRS